MLAYLIHSYSATVGTRRLKKAEWDAQLKKHWTWLTAFKVKHYVNCRIFLLIFHFTLKSHGCKCDACLWVVWSEFRVSFDTQAAFPVSHTVSIWSLNLSAGFTHKHTPSYPRSHCLIKHLCHGKSRGRQTLSSIELCPFLCSAILTQPVASQIEAWGAFIIYEGAAWPAAAWSMLNISG